METRNPALLKPHPVSQEIYGDVETNGLIDSIRELGILVPLLITGENIVISGCRRWKTALDLGLSEVPVEIKSYSSNWDEKRDILEYNRYREKTFTQKMREAELLKEIVAQKARERIKEHGATAPGKPKTPVLILAQVLMKRKTDEIVATQVGLGHRETYRKAEKVWHKAQKDNKAKELISALDKGELSINRAYELLSRQEKEAAREKQREENKLKVQNTSPLEAGVKFATILIDPPWDWDDEGDVNQLGRAKPPYATLSFEKILKLPVSDLSDKDCHLYLWITNRSLPKGFALIEAWGFRYITCLTWCKPSFGMGNYFRGQTEHILFAVKGSQSLKRHDIGTWFLAERGSDEHSSKPSKAYEIIESCSPWPSLEMFARSKRDGWISWGAEIEG